MPVPLCGGWVRFWFDLRCVTIKEPNPKKKLGGLEVYTSPSKFCVSFRSLLTSLQVLCKRQKSVTVKNVVKRLVTPKPKKLGGVEVYTTCQISPNGHTESSYPLHNSFRFRYASQNSSLKPSLNKSLF